MAHRYRAGAPGESFRVQVLRGQDRVDFFTPHVPLGVRLGNKTMKPL
jgi:hypothetical protein